MQPMPASTSRDPSDGRQREFLASRVRSNAGSAGLGAACLLFFGFWQLSPGNGADLLNFSWSLAYHTFRIGGVLLGLVALGSLSGIPALLLLDALVSIPVGASMLICGVTRLGPSAIEAFILVIAGLMFLRSGWFNARMYMDSRRMPSPQPTGGGEGIPMPAGERYKQAREEHLKERPSAHDAPTPDRRRDSLASRLLNEARAERSQPSPPVAQTPGGLDAGPLERPFEGPGATAFRSRSLPAESPSAKPAPAADSASPPSPADAPPEGFLAAMARKNHDEK
ncbi:MAG: hypothetical protein IT449_18600 [Phycisphaerales bacterium]|nr:hypothetical protein [Phycisphaerales bacterium]